MVRTNIKKKTSKQVSVGPLKDGERLVADDGEIDILNNYFCSVFTNENLANMSDPEQLY